MVVLHHEQQALLYVQLAKMKDSFQRRPRHDYLVIAAAVFCALTLFSGAYILYAGDFLQVCELFSPLSNISNDCLLLQQTLASLATSSGEHYLRDANEPGRIIVAPADRTPDLLDSFANYTKSADCSLSSLDLHDPFHPLCSTKATLLRAMTDGGRRGFDAPYVPNGCDMRWFTTVELCKILSRFERVHVIGDSMMRNLAVGMNTMLRADLIEGPHISYTPDPEGFDCRCEGAFAGARCLFNAAFSSKLVWDKDEGAPIVCPRADTAVVEFNPQLEYPLDSLHTLMAVLPNDPDVIPKKPHAFVFGHGLWNNVNTTATKLWLQQIQDVIVSQMPYLHDTPSEFHRLFLTPSASGVDKPVQFELLQGNSRLIQFEKEMGIWLREENTGIDHLGIWNLTVQNTSPDGTHAGMRSNLVKAMMVFNWLARIDEDEDGTEPVGKPVT